jgi:hypothetical protein
MITIEQYGHTEEEFNELDGWWRNYGAQSPPKGCLPKLGVWAMDGGERVASAFLYMDNSVGVSMLEWLIGKPGINPVVLKCSLEAVVDFMRGECRDMGYNVMFSHCHSDVLSSIVGRLGFSKLETVNSMVAIP